MTLILLDGCEDKSSWIGTQYDGITIGAGRTGNCFVVSNVNNQSTFRCQASETSDTWTVGFACRWPSTIGSSGHLTLGADGGITEHVRFGISTAGLVVWRMPSTVIASYAFAPVSGTWYYVEVTAKLGDSPNGTISAWLNGTQVITATGLDTKNAGTAAVFDSLIVVGQGATTHIDDLYVMNDTARLGDVKVETLYPNGNGAANAWTGSDGDSTDNYLLVDEVGAPNVGDYVQSATAGQQDLYTMTDLAAGIGTVRAVYQCAHAIKTDSGSRQLKLLQRGAATNASPALALGTSFVNVGWGTTTNPETSAPYTRTEVNALQSGVECA